MGKIAKALGFGNRKDFPGSTGKDSSDYAGDEEPGNPGDDGDDSADFAPSSERSEGVSKVHVMAMKAFEKAGTSEEKAAALKDFIEACS